VNIRELTLPLEPYLIRELKTGDTVTLTGVMATGRDTVHTWMVDTFIDKSRKPKGDDQEVYEAIRTLLKGSVIYHCGPVVSGLESGNYEVVAAGPTTSIRKEPYQSKVMHHFDLRGVIGKGGMGSQTLQACLDIPAVYFQAIGGAATLIAGSVEEVLDVYKLDFGVPEAIWVLRVKDFPVVVSMDAHGNSIHDKVEAKSKAKLQGLIKNS